MGSVSIWHMMVMEDMQSLFVIEPLHLKSTGPFDMLGNLQCLLLRQHMQVALG